MAKTSRLLSLWSAGRFPLIVSLPVNSLDLARAAEAGGADALKVHLNVSHFASGTRFGSFTEELPFIKNLLSQTKLPVGILPGEKSYATLGEMRQLKELGVDFMDSFLKVLPEDFKELEMPKVIAPGHPWTPALIKQIEDWGADAIEATIFPHALYRTPLLPGDFDLYRSLTSITKLPVAAPTQKTIRPEEIAGLKEAGVHGLVIGAVVTGNTADTLQPATRKFREAIDRLP